MTPKLRKDLLKTNRKTINTQLSLVVNKTCIQEHLLPAYRKLKKKSLFR